MNDDFIDLRSGNLSSESFWPSFTDIMTVVVMIFLIAMVVLLLPSRTGQESGMEKAALLPGLQEQVNEIDWLRVSGAGNAVIATLRRADDRWVV